MFLRFLFDKPVEGRPLRLLRFGTGFTLLIAFVALWPDFPALYGPDGVLPQDLVSAIHSSAGWSLPALVQTVHEATGWSPAVLLHGAATCYALLCILLMGGLAPRVVAIALLLLHSSMFTVQVAYSYGFDFLGSVALFYCVVLPHTERSPWARPGLRVLQLHLCLIYFFSGISKAVGYTWWTGEALYKALHLPAMPPLIPLTSLFPVLGNFPFVFAISGWAVMAIEIGYAAGIWWRRTFPVFLYGAVMLHLATALLLGLYHFAVLMMVLNCSAFLGKRLVERRENRAGILEAAKSTPSAYPPAV